jgi:hypothetical protein
MANGGDMSEWSDPWPELNGYGYGLWIVIGGLIVVSLFV